MRIPAGAIAGLATLAGVAFAPAAHSASILLGTSSGGIAVVYNCSAQGAACENPANVAYYRSVASPTNSNGAYFEFSNAPLPELGGASFRALLSGIGPGVSQFGFDATAPGAGAGSGTPAIPFVPLNAADNTGGLPAIGGVVDWAINDYKPNGGGVAGAGNAPYNSLFRGGTGDGGSVALTFSNLVATPNGFSIDIEGALASDGILHWFNPLLTDGSFTGSAPFHASGRLLFSGTLTYDTGADTTAGVDYYMGNINVFMEVPEPMSLALFATGLAGLAATRRRAGQGNGRPGGTI